MEPCSILQELGFSGGGFGKGSPTSPTRNSHAKRVLLLDHTFSWPNADGFSTAPHLGSPSFTVCPAPLLDAESPYCPDDDVAFEVPRDPVPTEVLPNPDFWSKHCEPFTKAPQAAAVVPRTPGMKPPRAVVLARTLVKIDLDGPCVSKSAIEPSKVEEAPLLKPPLSPPRSRPCFPNQQSPGPYRGGVLSLFTPSPPSPPRRAALKLESSPAVNVKDMDEDAQIAMALEFSLKEVAKPAAAPKAPKQLPQSPAAPKMPKQSPTARRILAVARPWRCNRQRVSLSI